MTVITLIPRARKIESRIVIDANALAQLKNVIADLGSFDHVVILYDRSIEPVAMDAARNIGTDLLIAVESGEESKTMVETERIARELLTMHASRRSLIVNVGGGMLTDLGGFVASIYARGIPFVHVPTTMLGMVDASIGGKTGVDLGKTKNMLGTITQSAATVIDTDLLKNLPDALLREGLVEAVKIAAMIDADAFAWLEKNMQSILGKDPDSLRQCVESAVRLKVSVVEEDERESHSRMFVNFGHTIGHAVEAASRFAISHGKAVSIGMVAEMAVAGTQEAERLVALLDMLGMPKNIPETYDDATLWQIMKNDKKVAGGTIRIAVPSRIGTGAIRELTEQEFRSLRA